MKFNLQNFAEAVQGKKIVYLYRVYEEAATAAGAAIAFTTSNGRSKSKSADTTATKDGSIRTPGNVEQEITCSSILAKDDDMIEKLEDALDNDKLIEIWEANLDEPVSGSDTKFSGMYFQGYITDFDISSGAEDSVEISMTFGINGAGVRGDVTVTATQQEIAAYAFIDTPATGA